VKKLIFVIPTFILFFIFNSILIAEVDKTSSEIDKLSRQKKYSKALELVNKEIQKDDKSQKLLRTKSTLLLKLNRYEEALQASTKAYNLSDRKSPWKCMDILSIYLKIGNNEAAFKWLNTAVERGLMSYGVLYDKEYEPLRKDKRFNSIIKRIKDSIGIGSMAKDFSVTLISGERISLSKLKGKVVLIDFWATWCPPCVKGIPHLKEFYKKYKNLGFEIIGISLDKKKELVDEYVSKEQLKWKIVYSGKAWLDDTAKLYKVNLIPSYWIIDKKGILRDFGTHLRDEHKLEQAIKKLL